MYDITKAKSMCLNLSYLSPKYVVLATPDTQDLSGTYVEISFIARFVTFLGVLGVAVIITCFILKSLGACHDESYEVTESDPISQHQEVKSIYGTYEEEANCGRSSSSEDLYDGRICVICYDNSRNCFFVPCGHFATCQVADLEVGSSTF
ncbi:E3 ubiquitin-protein ligase APD4-like [Solanum verrucosum]|uniref:E3 ubiquitin-protein ligase APD4-like n=1 Tax=Solanum verrucosum TaxID=315347 RepID=UPI0020D02685|nr:E3 ubiquitin-protein ligase APD4-like [Solanum verrucosum]